LHGKVQQAASIQEVGAGAGDEAGAGGGGDVVRVGDSRACGWFGKGATSGRLFGHGRWVLSSTLRMKGALAAV
jgi:hypothetical protein